MQRVDLFRLTDSGEIYPSSGIVGGNFLEDLSLSTPDVKLRLIDIGDIFPG